MFTGLTYCYLNLHSDSSLREAFTICPHFQCSQYKNKKPKLEAEVIKLKVKPTLMELGGEESRRFGCFFFLEFSFCCLLSSDFKDFSKGRLVLFPSCAPSQCSRLGFDSPGVPQNLPHTGYPHVSQILLCLIISLFSTGSKAKIVNMYLFWSCLS